MYSLRVTKPIDLATTTLGDVLQLLDNILEEISQRLDRVDEQRARIRAARVTLHTTENPVEAISTQMRDAHRQTDRSDPESSVDRPSSSRSSVSGSSQDLPTQDGHWQRDNKSDAGGSFDQQILPDNSATGLTQGLPASRDRWIPDSSEFIGGYVEHERSSGVFDTGFYEPQPTMDPVAVPRLEALESEDERGMVQKQELSKPSTNVRYTDEEREARREAKKLRLKQKRGEKLMNG